MGRWAVGLDDSISRIAKRVRIRNDVITTISPFLKITIIRSRLSLGVQCVDLLIGLSMFELQKQIEETAGDQPSEMTQLELRLVITGLEAAPVIEW
jgi:hypothetical protein